MARRSPPPPPAKPATRPNPRTTLQVSRATAKFLAAGHPWVRPDRFTVGLDAFRAGDVATLVDESGARLASAIIDPRDELCARVFHRKPDLRFDPAAAVARAWGRRAALHADRDTTCYRVVHGEGDFLPAVRVERYGPVFVVLVLADAMTRYADAIAAAVAEHARALLAPDAQNDLVVVVRDHREDLRKAGVSARRLDGRPLDPDAVVVGRELGLDYPLRPFAGLATGLYVDQRATRVWLRPFVRGARVANLFAYTGAFSLAALAAGATSAIDVDLAGPPLERAREAAALNHLAGHATAKADVRAWLAATDAPFDVIIVDPPTAAQGGDGWVLRRDYPEVLRLAFARLAPGGLLLAACNTLGKPYALADAVHEAASATRTPIDDLAGPPLGDDLPQLAGFPEGRPHRMVAVRSARR